MKDDTAIPTIAATLRTVDGVDSEHGHLSGIGKTTSTTLLLWISET